MRGLEHREGPERLVESIVHVSVFSYPCSPSRRSNSRKCVCWQVRTCHGNVQLPSFRQPTGILTWLWCSTWAVSPSRRQRRRPNPSLSFYPPPPFLFRLSRPFFLLDLFAPAADPSFPSFSVYVSMYICVRVCLVVRLFSVPTCVSHHGCLCVWLMLEFSIDVWYCGHNGTPQLLFILESNGVMAWRMLLCGFVEIESRGWEAGEPSLGKMYFN